MPDRTEAAHSFFFFFSSRRRHTRSLCYWSSDVCSSDLPPPTTSPASTGTCACLLPRFGSLCAPGQCDPARLPVPCRLQRSEERRVGKECRSRWRGDDAKAKKDVKRERDCVRRLQPLREG